MLELDAIRERDAELHYCATCGSRYWPSEPGAHATTVEECERLLAEACKAHGEPVRGCWTPEDHHPFVEGDIPDYEQAACDRRTLLAIIDSAMADR